ncbi:anti-sigma factor family protein [Pseudomonadota bacterium]
MLDERTLNLINADIDRELTPVEQQELDSILETSAEARAMRAELLRLSNLLNSVPEQALPDGLSSRILNQLAPPRTISRFSLASLFESFQPVTTGLAFAAGLLLTVGYYEMSPHGMASHDTAGMVGTMVAGQNSGLNLLENNLYFKGDDFSGSVSLSQNNGLYVLNFDLESTDRQEIKVGLDQTGLAFGGFAETPGISHNVMDSVIISGGTLRVVSQGQQQFAVFLRGSSPEQAVAAELITIDFSSDNDLQNVDGSES